MQLFFREGFNCLDNGIPGAPGHVGDFVFSFEHFSINHVRFVFQNYFLFMPCQIIIRITNFPARRVCKFCKFRHIRTLLHVWSLFTTDFYCFQTECVPSRGARSLSLLRFLRAASMSIWHARSKEICFTLRARWCRRILQLLFLPADCKLCVSICLHVFAE